jgi:hypothetical protein
MNVTGVQTLWETSDKFTKIPSWLDVHKCEISWAHLLARNCSSYTGVNMTWFVNKNKSLNWNLNQTTLEFHSNFKATVTIGVSQPTPLTEISTEDLEGETVLTGTMNSHTFPHCGNTKSGWRQWRKSSLSQVASSSVWLLHCIMKNFMGLHLVTQSFWSRTLIGCPGFDKSASSGVTSGNTMSMGVFKHFFNCDTWRMLWTPSKDGGRSNL